MNSRLADAVSIIYQVRDLAVKVDADLVLFGGDMFHVRRHIAVQAFNAVYEAMTAFALERIPIVMIHGNHDQADKKGQTHSIYSFQSFCTVIDKPDWHSVTDKRGKSLRLCAVPYMENVEHLRDVITSGKRRRDEPALFLGHLGIQGAKVGADFVYTNPHDPAITDLSMDRFDAGFLGHYHEHQQLPASGNFWYIGAPLHHTWGDRHDQRRGCIVYDTETVSFQRVPLKAPEFVEMHRNNIDVAAWEDNYVRIIDPQKWSDPEREDLRQQKKARSLEIVSPQDATPKTATPRLVIKPGVSYADLVQTYVRSGVGPMGDLDENYLMSLGSEILAEIEE